MEGLFRIPYKLYQSRLACKILGSIEVIFTLALAITIVFDFYISTTYAYILFFEILHLFSWAFMISIGCEQLDSLLTIATIVLYILNFLLDFGSTIWRLYIISETFNASVGEQVLLWIIFVLVLLVVFLDVIQIFFSWSILMDSNIYREDIKLRLGAFISYEESRVKREELEATAIILNSKQIYDTTRPPSGYIQPTAPNYENYQNQDITQSSNRYYNN
jgi:hypothetical protein